MNRKINLLTAAMVALPFALGGCVVADDTPDVVPGPSSTTIIEKNDTPDVHVTPAPNVTVENRQPPVVIEKTSPPDVKIDIKNEPPPATTG